MTHQGESTRQQKVSRLILKELGTYFQREAINLCPGKMISVTHVRITPDLGLARIYLSIFPATENKTSLQSVKIHVKTIRHYLGEKIKNQLRIVPELEFFIDDSLDYYEKIDQLLKK